MKLNPYVERYIERRREGFNPIEAFGVVAAGIAAHGTMEDLKEVEKVRWNDSVKLLNEWEERSNEPITRTVSAI